MSYSNYSVVFEQKSKCKVTENKAIFKVINKKKLVVLVDNLF